MKKRLLMFIALAVTTCVNAQPPRTTVRATSSSKPIVVDNLDSFKIKVDSLLTRIEYLLNVNNVYLDHLDINSSLKGRYKLYQTENIYNLLQLDTKTGMIEQVQWSLDDNNKEGTFTINDRDLSFGDGYGSGTFELYPTKNMYQFILIDKTNGRKWHVQWGIGDSKRWIRRIY